MALRLEPPLSRSCSGDHLTTPHGARGLFVFGCVALVIAVSAVSESKLLEWISIVGSASLAGGLAWLKLWDHFVVERGGAYSWQAPQTATWIVLGSCMALGVRRFRCTRADLHLVAKDAEQEHLGQ